MKLGLSVFHLMFIHFLYNGDSVCLRKSVTLKMRNANKH